MVNAITVLFIPSRILQREIALNQLVNHLRSLRQMPAVRDAHIIKNLMMTRGNALIFQEFSQHHQKQNQL